VTNGPQDEAAAQRAADLAALNLERAKALSKINAENLTLAEAAQKANEGTIRALERQTMHMERELELAIEKGDKDQDELDALLKKIDANKRLVGLAQDNLDLANRRVEAQGKLRDIGGDILRSSMGINTAWKDSTMLGTLVSAAESGEDFADNLNLIADGFEDMIQPLNVAGMAITKLFDTTKQMVLSLDGAFASFNAATGQAGKYNETIVATADAAAKFGIDAAGAGEAAQALFVNMSSYTDLAPDVAAQLGTTAAGLEKMGFGAANAGKIMDHAMKGWGMSVGEAEQMTMDLAASAQALGMDITQYGAQFQTAMKELGKYGPEAVDIFKDLAAVSKTAGVEMDTLMGIADQFDTIDKAAEASSKLNMIMGGNLFNSMELLNLKEHERIKVVQKRIAQSGRSWSAMDQHERQALAATLQISDMAEANRLFGMSASAYEENAKKSAEATMHQEQLAEATKASTSMGEKFALIMERMAIGASFIVEGINWILDGLLELGDAAGWILFGVLILGLWALSAVIRIVAKKMGQYIGEGMGEAIRGVMDATGEGAEQLGESIQKMGQSIRAVWPSILAIGAAFLMMGLALFLVVYGIVLLARAIGELSGGQMFLLAGILIGIGVGLYFAIPALLSFAAASAASAVPILMLGAAFALFGLAVLLAGVGLWIVANAILMLVPHVASVFLLVVALGLLAAVLWGLSLVAFPIFLGMILISSALVILGVGIAAVAIPMMLFSLAVTMLAAGIKAMAAGMWAFADALFAIVPLIPQVMLLAGSMMLLGMSAMLLTVFGPLAGIGLGIMALGVGYLAAALLLIKTKDLIALGVIMTGFAAAAKNMDKVKSAAGYIDDMNDSLLDGLPVYEDAIPLLAMLGTSFVTFGGDVLMGVAALELFGGVLSFLTPIMELFTQTFDHLAFAVLPQFFSMTPMWLELAAVWLTFMPIAMMLAAVIREFALWSMIAAYGMMSLGASLFWAGAAINSIQAETLNALAEFFKALVLALQGGIAGMMDDISWSLWQVSWATNLLDESATASLGHMFHGLAVAFPEIAKPEAPEQLEKVVQALNSVETSWMDKIGDVLDPFGIYGGIFDAMTGGGGKKEAAAGTAGAGNQTIILKVDGRELGRAVTKSLNQVNNLQLG